MTALNSTGGPNRNGTKSTVVISDLSQSLDYQLYLFVSSYLSAVHWF